MIREQDVKIFCSSKGQLYAENTGSYCKCERSNQECSEVSKNFSLYLKVKHFNQTLLKARLYFHQEHEFYEAHKIMFKEIEDVRSETSLVLEKNNTNEIIFSRYSAYHFKDTAQIFEVQF